MYNERDASPCPWCGTANTSGRRYCSNCGGQLRIACQYCGSIVATGYQYCQKCGAPMPDGIGMAPSGGYYGYQSPPFWEPAVKWLRSLPLSYYLVFMLVILIIAVGSFTYWQLAPKPDTRSPAITGISVINQGKSFATIVWYTDEASSSQVEYGKTIRYGFRAPAQPQNNPSTGASAGVTKHSVYIQNLVSGSTYHFRVKSKDASGNETVSADNTFKTGEELPFFQPAD